MANPEIEKLLDEINRLQTLITEIFPVFALDVYYGVKQGTPPLDHIEDTPCDDCKWYEESVVWEKRITNGELGQKALDYYAELKISKQQTH